jgi:hypothetical protein
MSEFKAHETPEGDKLRLAFEGTIDEDVVFPPVDASKFKTIVLDLKNVKSINSVGIREWLNWIRPLAEKSDFVLENCPKAVVFQFNMVEGFLPPRSTVSSFYVPFYCEKCDKEDSVLFNVGKEIKAAGGKVEIAFDVKTAAICEDKANAANCEMEMDVTEAKYFQFLKR